ncbi:MAG: hypothetical protein AAB456_00225 [Patescibacteria group bacterium]
MKKGIKQFFLGQFGELYFLYNDGTMAMGEQEHTEDGIKVNIIKKIIINENANW